MLYFVSPGAVPLRKQSAPKVDRTLDCITSHSWLCNRDPTQGMFGLRTSHSGTSPADFFRPSLKRRRHATNKTITHTVREGRDRESKQAITKPWNKPFPAPSGHSPSVET